MNRKIDNTGEGPRLRPDTTIRFEKKRQLYRKRSRLPLLFSLSGIAAISLFFLGIRLFWGNRETTPESQPLFSSETERIQPVQAAQTVESRLSLAGRLPDALSYRKVPVRSIEAPPEMAVSLYVALPATEREPLPLEAEPLKYEQEWVLNKSAEYWKSSDDLFHSRNIFSSLATGGKQVTE